MSVAIKLLSPLLLLLTALPATGYALSCKSRDGSTEIVETIGAPLAIPANAPNGTIIWESEERTVDVVCNDDYNIKTSENIFFYVNPEKKNIGQGIQIGIRFNNKTIVQTSGAVSTGYQTGKICDKSNNCENWGANIQLKFTVFVQKFGAVPTSGTIQALSNYRVFQLDGREGLNTRPQSNINYVVNGLSNIRFVACEPDIKITPETLDFGSISIKAVQINKVVGSRSFTVALNRWCDTPYTVNARFTPSKGQILEDKLVPNDNPSVGISIRNLQSNTQAPFGKWFKLTDLKEKIHTHNFEADLIWLKNNPIGGKFNAGVTMDLYYQ
ncbi:hypothetical protein BLX41_04820 [Pseudomonas protegens]|uniref:fimbrial protein n=1 Tax=Pseudomonas protegens TaxID=380021 RepID=UPI000F4B6297|nr:fimbrial protein [Pseudomonas protegens]ROL81473.1 hypothetical protein BLX41_04820 [Pseudomonas protegens]